MHFTVDNLQEVFPLAEFIADSFGPMAEIVVHDITRPENSIVFIRNGQLSGRSLGDGITDQTLQLTIRADQDGADFVSDYRGRRLNKHEFRVSSYLIRNQEQTVIGLLCISINITGLQQAAHVLQTLSSIDSDDVQISTETSRSHMSEEPAENIRRITRDEVRQFNIPMDKLTKQDRLDIIRNIKDRGIFLIKGAVGIVAPELKISIPTLYRYLQALK
ncbi:PAS domain-containing protein [Bifidobacterium sp. W8113]|uniref:helix-turn-helix transcriptional regulator n=1 Tax=Bifidobacterium choladohabitans TaxID=2750947 RepID=UPI0018DE189A|nr:PAS domain-containing protein [Bifidobacterium choladohabitans]MBI0090369.1 PAS domain-containing protein [Bifidobacterium choladohabitans]